MSTVRHSNDHIRPGKEGEHPGTVALSFGGNTVSQVEAEYRLSNGLAVSETGAVSIGDLMLQWQ